MELKKFAFIFVIAFFSAWPVSLRAQVSPPFESPPVITEVEARRFLDEYVAQYVRMDVETFMTFFSRKAIENRMLTYADIREIYQRTFENSHSLQYDLEIYTVQTYKESTTVTGRYEVIQIFRANPFKKVYRGNIKWELIREGGVLKIKEINYGRDYQADQPGHPYP